MRPRRGQTPVLRRPFHSRSVAPILGGRYTTLPREDEGEGFVSSKVNRLRNPRFSHGREVPRGWSWEGTAGASWRCSIDADGRRNGLLIEVAEERAEGRIEQRARCRPGDFYRVEAVVEAHLKAQVGLGGCSLCIAPATEKPQWLSGAAVAETGDRQTLRGYYEAAEDCREVRIGVEVRGAVGSARVEEVRFIRILEPEEEAHVMAIALPDLTLPAPRTVRQVAVCSATGAARPITQRLRAAMGEACVAAGLPGDAGRMAEGADAVLLPDEAPPKGLRSLRALLNLAAERIVVISLPAFAKLAGEAVRLRRIEQPDDPIHARITLANHATRGFMLHDAIPFAWTGKESGSFVQRQFRKTAALKGLCEKYGFLTLLDSLCDKDSTSYQPVCLYRPTSGGALVVMDVEPMEETGTSFAEPVLPMHLLLSLLGHPHVGLGQHVVPHVDEADFRGMLREMSVRYRGFRLLEADVPIDEVTEQLVLIGGEDESFGLPLRPKPLLLVRSGLASGDMESVYGALMWFKQLVRMEPFVCLYAAALCTRFRLAWLPLACGWPTGRGWHLGDNESLRAYELELDNVPVAAVIDVCGRPVQQARVLVQGGDGTAEAVLRWLPRLHERFPAGQVFSADVPWGASLADRGPVDWRHVGGRVAVEAVSGAATDDVHRAVLASGGHVVRLEVPGWVGDFTSQSIARTALVATLLEQVIGLHHGLIAVNRLPETVSFPGFGEVAPGQALIVDHHDPRLKLALSQAG